MAEWTAAMRAPARVLSCLILAALAVACGGTLTYGDKVRGSWAAGDSVAEGRYHDRWDVELEGGRRVRLDLEEYACCQREPVLLLLDGAGTVVARVETRSGGARLLYRPPTGGRHRLVVSADSSANRQHYRLWVRDADATDAAGPGEQVSLVAGEWRRGVLEPGDELVETRPLRRTGGFVDRFAIAADSGAVITIAVTSTDFDPFLAVASARNGTEAVDDDGGVGSGARLVYKVRNSDSVRVAVMSFGQPDGGGDYTVGVETGGSAWSEPDSTELSNHFPVVAAPEWGVCRGKPMPSAAAFDSTRSGPRVVEVIETASLGLLASGSPRTAEDVELVLYLAHSHRVIQTCYYQGPPVERIVHAWHGRLVAARTAVSIAEGHVEGQPPRGCAGREPLQLTRLDGSMQGALEAAAAFRAQFQRYIDPGSVPVTHARTP